jgi:chitin disaccharide deacetylase
MKYLLLAIVLLPAFIQIQAQDDKEIFLIVRADDMGSFHDANLACLKACKDGIARSVEIMVPCAWFPEAVQLMKENPNIDVGIHLVLTSEWEGIKWRPLTNAPSLVDRDGYFYQFIWGGDNPSANNYLLKSDWKIEEVEKEFRAQIELAKKYLPQISHLSAHMGCTHMDSKVNDLLEKLAREYKLGTENIPGIKELKGWDNKNTLDKNIDQFISIINSLKPGKYVFIEHPGLNNSEMHSALFSQNNTLAYDRQMVTDIYTNAKVLKALRIKGVKLISYAELIR